MIHALSHERDNLPLVEKRRLGRFLYAFWTELGIICGGAVEFGFVLVIVTAHGSTGPLNLNVERHVAILIFGLVIEGQFALDILKFFRVRLGLYFIGVEVFFIGSFQAVWIIVSRNNIQSTG